MFKEVVVNVLSTVTVLLIMKKVNNIIKTESTDSLIDKISEDVEKLKFQVKNLSEKSRQEFIQRWI